MVTKPNPGSEEARELGCKCPVMDNHGGAGRGGDGRQFGWFVRWDCPVHSVGKDK